LWDWRLLQWRQRHFANWFMAICCTCQLVDWLIIYCFTSHSRTFHLYGDVTNIGEGLQNLDLYLALRVIEQGGICIMPHILWHGVSVFPVSSERPPRSVAFYDTQGDVSARIKLHFSKRKHGSCLVTVDTICI
jgi:hypothetical protein